MINKFLNYLQLERNYSQRTVESYGEDLTAFESYFKNLSAELTWESVDSDVIRGWMEEMMDKGNNATSINRRLSALRSFYRFALSRHLVKRDPSHMIKGPKKEKPLPKFIREADIDRLLEPEMWKDTYDDLLARTIILILYTTGLRLSELVGLDDEMVDFVNSQLKVTGKRNKQRIIPFGNELAEELRKYIAVRDEKVVRVTPGLLLTESEQYVTERRAYCLLRIAENTGASASSCAEYIDASACDENAEGTNAKRLDNHAFRQRSFSS